MPRVPGDPDHLMGAADMLEHVCADLRTRTQVAARGSDVATAQWSGAGSQAFEGTSLEHTLRLDGAHRRLSRLAGSLRVQAARLRSLQDEERTLTRVRESVLTQLQQRGPEHGAARAQDLVQLRRLDQQIDEVGRRARVEGVRAQRDLEGHRPVGAGDRMRTGPVEPVGRGPEHRMRTGPEVPFPVGSRDRMQSGPETPFPPGESDRMRTGPVGRAP